MSSKIINALLELKTRLRGADAVLCQDAATLIEQLHMECDTLGARLHKEQLANPARRKTPPHS